MKLLFVAGLGLMLGGCAAPGLSLVNNYCQIAQPVRVSRADTRLTKEQADREYRKYVAVCGTPPA